MNRPITRWELLAVVCGLLAIAAYTSKSPLFTHVTVNNTTAKPGDSDIEVKVDPNHDSAIAMDTNNNTLGAWFFQASDSGFNCTWEIVSKLYEPLTLWGCTGNTKWDGTMDYQQPTNGDAPFHLIRATDSSPTGKILDVESIGGGFNPTVFWSLDSQGLEYPLKVATASLPTCSATTDGGVAIATDAANAAGCTIGSTVTTGGSTYCAVVCHNGTGWVHY